MVATSVKSRLLLDYKHGARKLVYSTRIHSLVPRMELKSQVAFGEQFPKAEHALYQVPYSPSFLSKDLTKLQSVDSVCIVTAPKQSL